MTTKFLNTTTALCLSLTAALGAAAQAQTGLSIDIDAQHMVDAVAELGETAGIQIIGANELLNGKISVPVRGESDPMRALELMLNDPALEVSGLSDGTLIVAPVGGANTVSQNAQNEVPFVLPPIIFRSDRSAQPIGDIPRAVKNIDAIELRQSLNKTTNFSAGLSELIPGFSPSVFQNSTSGLTLRGREPLYLLDGIPLSNGQFGVTLQFIDSEAIENIEVLYGPTALYGNGATGGVIQFFTKDPTEDPLLRFSTGVTTSLASGSEFDGDSFTYRVAGEARGRADRFGYVAIASYESNGAQFDPDGNRIGPTRLDDFDDYAFFGKLTYDIGDTSTIEALVNFTQSAAVDTDFASILAPGARSATTVFSPSSFAKEPQQEGLYFSVGYQNSDLLGADFSIQAYFAQEDLVQIGTDISAAGLPPIFPSFFQTSSEEESYGLRSDLRFNVTDALRLNLGLDYRTEKDLSLLIISTAAGGAPAFFDGSSTVNQDPPFELETFGLFAQGTYEVTPRFRINAGLRYDYFDYTVGPSTPVFVPPPSLGFRPGGTGDGDGFSYNIGAIYDISDTTSVFASFAQGFSIPNFQLQARFVAPGVSVNDILEPVVVDSYEVGIRGELYSTEYSFAAFFAESDLGETAQIDPATGFGSIVRSPQRNYGFEFASHTAVTSQLDVSTSIAWNDGENDANNDGQFLALSSLSVLPLNIRVRADYQVNPRLALSGSINYLASRSDALNDGVDSLASEEHLTVDVGLTYDIPQDRGQLSFQVTNLFNEFYLPLESTTRVGGTANRRFAAPGREMVVNYSVEF